MFHSTNLFGSLKSRQVLFGVMLVLPALLINLGLLPLIGDESIRALVGLEMMLSGDFITPTLNGELYFNKPPLFNWILAGFFRLFNRTDEFIVRLPTILFLLTYCYTIYWCLKKELGKQLGILAAMMFLTCGRILFWDSFLGLIDIVYSWLIFLNFMIIWFCYQRQNFTRLFLLSYSLIAVTFLLKGLPSVVFQGITLTVLFVSNKNARRLFCWQHLAGILLFLMITGTYYLMYYLKNPDHLSDVILRIFSESVRKSAIGSGFAKTFQHLFTFPFEVIYHFLPWTLLIIFLFDKKILGKAFSNGFIRYCIVVFIANLLVYWVSPITYPRYLLMLIPLIFIVLLYVARIHALSGTFNYRIIKGILYGILIILVPANSLLPVIFADKIPVTHLYLKSLMVLMSGILVLYFFYTSQKSNLLFSLGMVFLISRISFDLFLVPYRQSISWPDKCRSDAIAVAKNTRGQELFLMTDTITIPNAYYLTRERKEILRFKAIPDNGPYFIVRDTSLYGTAFKKEFAMRVPYHTSSFYIGKFYYDNP